MSSRISRTHLLSVLVVALAFFHLKAQAQVCNASTGTSSFEFPLWNDGKGWKQFNLYSSIQLADIDGDGQAELIGNGPLGIEVWHWEFNGQAWIQMSPAGPTVASTDTIMTADVDGDGQAEIIQITPNLGSSPVVNVWHYDGNVNPQTSSGPGLWRLQPQLRLTLTPSVGSNSTAIAPTIKFASFANPASKQLQLVSMAIRVTPGLVYYTPFVYQVNSTKTGWTTLASGPMTNGGGTFANSVPASLQVGDVNGDGRPDIVLLEGVGKFLIFPQTSSSSGAVSFSSGVQAGPDPGGIFSSGTFALGDALGLGYQQIYTVERYSGTTSQDLNAYQFSPSTVSPSLGLIQVGLLPSVPSANGAGLQVAYTGLNRANPTGASILILNSDGLDEYGGRSLGTKISNTPFLSAARFGDDPSHYRTIQTGKVFNSSGRALETILLARDAGGIHTLLPVPAGQVCSTSLAGFVLPQFQYFPPAFTATQQEDYNNISSQLTGTTAAGQDLRSQYTNFDNDPSTWNKKLTNMLTNAPTCDPTVVPTSSACDTTLVLNELIAETSELTDARNYYTTAKATTSDIFSEEQLALTGILTALNLPPDASATSNLDSQLINLPLQAVGAVSEFIGNAGIPEASQISELISVVTDVIADVQQASAPSPTSLGSQTLVVSTQLGKWYNDVSTANANTYAKIVSNWDLLNTLSQRIDANLIDYNASDVLSSENQAVNAFEIGTWQILAPQVWQIYGADNFNSFTASGPLAGYPYVQQGSFTNRSDYQNCAIVSAAGRGRIITYYPNYLVYVKLASSSDQGFSFSDPPPPVAVAAMDQLAALGVDFHDVLAGRNGWQIPQDLTDWCYSSPWSISADAPVSGGSVTQALPGVLSVGGGQAAVPAQPFQCTVNNKTENVAINEQSTPINSVFPEPLTIEVKSLSNLSGTSVPIPGATVQITGKGLSPTTTTVVTDSNGFASVPLLANGIVQGPYLANVQVMSPVDPNAPSCALNVPYQLQNTLPVDGTVPTNPDVQAVVSVTGKAALFTTDRLWYVTITDPTGTATGGTYTAQLTHTRGPASCNPVPVPINGGFTAAGGGNFKTALGWDFSSCTGLNLFTLTVTGNFTIPLDDGSTYQASFSASTSNQTP
jgi:hypothetical protein